MYKSHNFFGAIIKRNTYNFLYLKNEKGFVNKRKIENNISYDKTLFFNIFVSTKFFCLETIQEDLKN